MRGDARAVVCADAGAGGVAGAGAGQRGAATAQSARDARPRHTQAPAFAMPRHDERRGVSGALRLHWRAVLGEVVATALLVLLGVGSCVPRLSAEDVPVAPPLAHPALAFGFVVLCLVQVFGEVSGAHMNPAVTLAAALLGRIPLALGAAYVAAQLAGAVLGYAALQALTPARTLAQVPALGVTLPARGVGAAAAAAVEAALTGTLVLLACALWTRPPPHDDSAPVKFGLVIAGLVYAGGEMTGASLNPARSFAPALLTGVWDCHWVYWAGPLGGAALCALLHRWVLAPHAHARAPRPAPAPAPAPPHEELPLADKTNNC